MWEGICMNVIIANKHAQDLQKLEIDVIKSLTGEFTVEEIISQFKNFFCQRMIIDITSIKNHKNISTLQKLSISLDMDKVILLLDDTPESSSPAYLSDLVSIGIYNFTKSIDGILYLYDHPNSYRDVAQYHQLEVVSGKNISGSGMEVVGATASVPAAMPTVTTHTNAQRQRIIGIQNVTKQSGATTFTYMLRNQLSKFYKVVAIEVDKKDFTFFRDSSLVSASTSELKQTLYKYSKADVIFLDINNSAEAKSFCHEIIYLIEPSVIKLNKLTFIDPNKIQAFKNEKVILNQSLLTPKDVLDFEYESGLKIFFNMPPLDEREKSIFILNKFLDRLGFDVGFGEEENKKHKLFGWL